MINIGNVGRLYPKYALKNTVRSSLNLLFFYRVGQFAKHLRPKGSASSEHPCVDEHPSTAPCVHPHVEGDPQDSVHSDHKICSYTSSYSVAVSSKCTLTIYQSISSILSQIATKVAKNRKQFNT